MNQNNNWLISFFILRMSWWWRIVPLLPRLVFQIIIQLASCHHFIQSKLCTSFFLQSIEKVFNCFHRYSQRWYWINNTIITKLFEFFKWNDRSLPKLGHIRKNHYFRAITLKFLCYFDKLFLWFKSLWKYHICACVNILIIYLYI